MERSRLATLTATICQVLATAKTLQQGLRECVEMLALDLDAGRVRIWTINPLKNVFEIQASAGSGVLPDGGSAGGEFFPVERIARGRKALLSNEVAEQGGDQDGANEVVRATFAGYPLMVEDRVVGVLGVFAPAAADAGYR